MKWGVHVVVVSIALLLARPTAFAALDAGLTTDLAVIRTGTPAIGGGVWGSINATVNGNKAVGATMVRGGDSASHANVARDTSSAFIAANLAEPGTYIVDADGISFSAGNLTLNSDGLPENSKAMVNVANSFRLAGGAAMFLQNLMPVRLLVNPTGRSTAALNGGSGILEVLLLLTIGWIARDERLRFSLESGLLALPEGCWIVVFGLDMARGRYSAKVRFPRIKKRRANRPSQCCAIHHADLRACCSPEPRQSQYGLLALPEEFWIAVLGVETRERYFATIRFPRLKHRMALRPFTLLSNRPPGPSLAVLTTGRTITLGLSALPEGVWIVMFGWYARKAGQRAGVPVKASTLLLNQ